MKSDERGTGERRAGKSYYLDIVFWRALLPVALVELVHELLFVQILSEATPLDYWNSIVAPLFVAAVVGFLGWIWGQQKAQRRVEAAPRRYVRELDLLIGRAIEEGEDKAIINARAIVAARNNLRSSLVSIAKSLNSEIDQLARDIGQQTTPALEVSGPGQNGETRSARQAYETIQVLARVWPTKRAEIQYEIRKLLAELGLSVAPLKDESTGPA